MSWGILSLVDTYVLFSGLGKYPAPVSIAALNLAVLYIYLVESYVSQSKERFVAYLASLIPAYTSFEQFLKELATKTWSLSSIRPIGYSIDQSFLNDEVQFNTHKVTFQNDSTPNKPTSDQYSLTFGDYGSLIFSDLNPIQRAQVSAFSEGASGLGKILANLVFPNSEKYEPVIKRFGHGHHQGFVFAVVIDINDYSIHTDRYGTAFTTFIASEVIPSIRNLFGSSWVVEANKGDEVVAFFISPSDIKENSSEIESAICKLFKFQNEQLSQLCINNGFETFTLSTGTANGETSIVIDPIGVRFSSSAINEAKRLQEKANKGVMLATENTFDLLKDKKSIKFSDPFDILVKKNIIKTRKVNTL